MVALTVALVVLVNGLAAGVLVGTVLGGVPLLLVLPDERYVHAHAFLAGRYDPFMPACLIATVLGDGALAALAPDRDARVVFATAGVLAAGTVAISLVKNVPINRWLRSLDPARLPADFTRRDPRRVWSGWNHARSVLAVLALLANCAAVALLL